MVSIAAFQLFRVPGPRVPGQRNHLFLLYNCFTSLVGTHKKQINNEIKIDFSMILSINHANYLNLSRGQCLSKMYFPRPYALCLSFTVRNSLERGLTVK
jgi:hypothetical protein